MKWIPIRSEKDLPEIDAWEDYPKEYLVRVKGDDPRSGWVYVGYDTAAQMRNIDCDYFEYLDEDEDPNVLPTMEQVTAELDRRYPFAKRPPMDHELEVLTRDWFNWSNEKTKEQRTAFLDVIVWIKTAKFQK